jgi:putative ABC transport system substrate-binding protein
MKRRDFITLLGGAAAAWPLPLGAQQPIKAWRIGMLEATSPQSIAANLNGFRQGLRSLGYEEGKNLAIEYRSADGRDERFRELAAELTGINVDLIVARGTPAILAARNATATIPIVMVAISDPLLAVASLARPGGNITGLTTLDNDLYPKRLELLKEIAPTIARIALLTNLSNPQGRSEWEKIEAAARYLGLQALLLDVRKSADIAPAFATASTQSVGALVVIPGGLMLSNRQLIVELAVNHKLPAIYASREFVETGGLIAYGPSRPDLYRRAATYVDKILKGTKPADLPVEQPTKFELIINLKSAKALGLTIPESFLLRADEVIE